ncbi:hypothetical protein ES703_72702 [subsurface metagenome]
MLCGDDRLLGGVHAADRRAVRAVYVPITTADALDPGDFSDLLAVRRSQDMPGSWTG